LRLEHDLVKGIFLVHPRDGRDFFVVEWLDGLGFTPASIQHVSFYFLQLVSCQHLVAVDELDRSEFLE